jgi:4-aminobutyrate aminotransferase-like enzyme
MGNANSLFYSEPLHIVRGEDVWLYDAEGKKYLDVYNNVAHVGHSNPYVVEAITRQAKALNTNTRYLHENIVDLAEKITKLMPGELSVCYFVCSGSEANDLALQIARTYTKKQGCLVSENAYHGNTTAVFQMSPEDFAPETRHPCFLV